MGKAEEKWKESRQARWKEKEQEKAWVREKREKREREKGRGKEWGAKRQEEDEKAVKFVVNETKWRREDLNQKEQRRKTARLRKMPQSAPLMTKTKTMRRRTMEGRG